MIHGQSNRPAREKDDVLAALIDAGFPAVTKSLDVAGRGKQRGIKIGEITYDEIPKVMLIMRRPRQGQGHS